MALLYKESDVLERVAKATPPLVVIDRRFDLALSEADELTLGIQDVVNRCLNSDVDGLFHLIGLFARSNQNLANKIANTVASLLDFSVAASQEAPVSSQRAADVVDLLDELLDAGVGRQDKIRGRLARTVEQFAGSSTTSAGAVSVGMDPAYAREQASSLAESLLDDVQVLQTNIARLSQVLQKYGSLKLIEATKRRFALYARAVMETHLDKSVFEQSGAILDSIVVNSLLQYSSQRLDVEAAKASGGFAVSALSSDSRVITLQQLPASGFTIRVGDSVLAAQVSPPGPYISVGRVSWVSGLSVTMRQLPGNPIPAGALNQPQQATQYQFRIESAGLTSYKTLLPQIEAQMAGIYSAVGDLSRARRSLEVFAHSGAVSPKTLAITSTIGSAATNIAALLGQYSFGKVDAVEELLQHLESERLTLVSSVLAGLDFGVLLALPSILSEQATATVLMEELAQDALTDVQPESYEYTSMLKDYARDGV